MKWISVRDKLPEYSDVILFVVHNQLEKERWVEMGCLRRTDSEGHHFLSDSGETFVLLQEFKEYELYTLKELLEKSSTVTHWGYPPKLPEL